MNIRSILVAAALLAVAAIPASGGTPGLAAGPADGGAQGAAFTPDFSGMWARVSFPGFGRPLAGAGPVINKYVLTVRQALTLMSATIQIQF